MNPVDLVEKSLLRADLPEFRPGDTVRVHVRVAEAGRERIQVFQGVVIRRQGGGLRETFTVRKVSFGVGVERTFPLHSPSISKLEVVSRGHVRRAKLYYLRERKGKKARIRERRLTEEEILAVARGQEAEEPEAEEEPALAQVSDEPSPESEELPGSEGAEAAEEAPAAGSDQE